MSWTSFIFGYLAVCLLALVLCRKLLAGNGWRLVRTLAFGTLLLMLGDLIAEERELWTITDPIGPHLLGAPIENALIVLATLLNSLLLYLVIDARSRRAASSARNYDARSSASRS